MDLYDIPSNYALQVTAQAAHGIENRDMFEDLNPYFAKGFARGASIDPPTVDVQGEMLPILRDVYLTSGDALVGIPHTINAVHLVHQSEHVQLAEVSSWDEYISELQRLDGQDRNGDGIGDKPFCLPTSSRIWAYHLLETIAGSFFQRVGSQDVRHFDIADAKMASTLNTPAMTEALRVFRQIWLLTDLTFDAAAYEKGTCVATLKPLMREQPFSPSTVVGSHQVHVKTAQGGSLKACKQATCPRALLSASGLLVNPAPFLVLGCVHLSIDQRSLLKDEAWTFLSFLHQPEVQFSMLVQQKSLPVLSSQFDPKAWRRSLEIVSTEELTQSHTPMQIAAVQTLLALDKLASLRSFSGLEAWLQHAEAEVGNPKSAAVLLGSINRFWEVSMEQRMHSVVHACTCRNNWDGFGICLNATGQYYDGEPNLITDEQFETFLRGGESPESPPRLRLTQDLTLLMDLHDAKAAAGGGLVWLDQPFHSAWTSAAGRLTSRAERLRELRSAFKLPTQHAPAKPERSTPPELRCGSLLGAAAVQCTTPGYYKRSLCGSVCEPCPAGFSGEISYQGTSVKKNVSTEHGIYTTTTTDLIRTCSRCPFNTYQPAQGKLGCIGCPNQLYGTGRSGATSKDECIVPIFELRPTLPLGCMPPACVDQPTPVDVFWHFLGTSSPEPETKRVRLKLFVEISWTDPRIALQSLVGNLLNEQAIQEGGVRKLTLTTSQWRQYGLWLPGYSVRNAVSGLSGELTHDDDAKLSNITLIQSRLPDGHRKAWPSQLFLIQCVWSRFLGSETEEAVINWDDLDWSMFPFGTNTLSIDVTCKPEANCTFHQQSTLGKYAVIENEDGPSTLPGRRLKVTARVAVASRSGGGEFPKDMPLVEDSLLWSMENGNATYRIAFTLKRSSMLQLVRLVIPTVLIMVLGVCVFFVADSTWTMEMTFNVLLVLSVISVEVKDFFPSHVTYMSWIDWFVVANLLLIVACSFLGLVCIIASESESDIKQQLGVKLDEAISETQPIAALVLNVALLCAGMIDGSQIEVVQAICFTFFVADVLVLALAIAVKSGKGEGGFFMRQRARFRRRVSARWDSANRGPPTLPTVKDGIPDASTS